jgi:hypothetical protein
MESTHRFFDPNSSGDLFPTLDQRFHKAVLRLVTQAISVSKQGELR